MTPLYLHGLPGSGAELALGGRSMPVLDRNAPSFAQTAIRLPAGPLHLIGFSLGAACALRLAVLAPEKIGRVTLISAAAPLELGDFLPAMAGAPVFRLARSHARLTMLTTIQSTLARLSPALMLKLLMKGADPADLSLYAGPDGAIVRRAVTEGLTHHKAVYLREVAAYVQPWARHLAYVRCPVDLHHGRADRWAPFEMAQTLTKALTRADVTLHPHADLGHYSTLKQVLPTL
ncbi:alpha/beta hydrolase [Pacificoceanicola onchidii]|uniref:alpha/beta hydrolase n=1 Tax=Pacificoceanicola onchidii TaxID=2562685 RepID=UPI0010A2C9D9|nr:alpha/beta hydrolase [Pacificoceanicola onchidii]